MEPLFVSSTSDVKSVAGAISYAIRENSKVELQSVGAGAVNQAVKSVAIAQGYLAPSGIFITCNPAFIEVLMHDVVRTGIKLTVEIK